MKIVYIVLLMMIAVSGAYCYQQFQRVQDKHDRAIQERYQACLARGADSGTCIIEEMSLRGLLACGK